jgi:LysR family hydrogen peroxide-inducible transcriptional activator
LPTLTQLHYIVTVDKLRHFGQAAKACNVSQPSLSMQIQKAEDEMGITLFDRAKKPIRPTEKGERFIEQAKRVLMETERLAALSRQDSTEVSGNFRLGIIPTVAPYLLPLFIEDFSTKWPKVRLKIDEMKTETIIAEIKRDGLDGAILATPIEEKGFRTKILFYEDFFLLVGSDHKFAHRKRLKEADLDGSEMWLLQDGHCLRNQVSKICSIGNDKGIFKNIRFEGGNLETLRYLIKKSRGYTLVPYLFVETLSDYEKKNLVKEFDTPVPSREVSLIYRRDQWKVDILSALEQSIRANLPQHLRHSLDKRKTQVIGIGP